MWRTGLDLARLLPDDPWAVPHYGPLATLEAKDAFLFQAPAWDRNAWLRALVDGPALTLTAAAQANLAAYRSADAPAPPTGQALLEALASHWYGDIHGLAVFARAIAPAPAPVVWNVVSHWFVVAVGYDTLAWVGGGRFPTDRRPFVIGDRAWEDVTVLRHELAHSWYDHVGPVPPVDVEWGAMRLARLAYATRGTVDAAAWDDAERRREHRAWTLARAWGLQP